MPSFLDMRGTESFVHHFGKAWITAALALLLHFPLHAQEPAISAGDESSAGYNPGAARNANRDALPDSPKEKNSLPIPPRRLSTGERFHLYVRSITTPDSVIGPAAGAAINQARNDPPEWGQGGGAYADRFASGYGRMLANHTIRFGVAAIDHEDPRFYPSHETGFWQRTRYATVHYFIVRSDSGGQMPAYSKFAGIYGAAFLSNLWYPDSHASAGQALKRGSTTLAVSAGWNVFREFWPDIQKAVHLRRDCRVPEKCSRGRLTTLFCRLQRPAEIDGKGRSVFVGGAGPAPCEQHHPWGDRRSLGRGPDKDCTGGQL